MKLLFEWINTIGVFKVWKILGIHGTRVYGPRNIGGPQNKGLGTGYCCNQDKHYQWVLLLQGWRKTCKSYFFIYNDNLWPTWGIVVDLVVKVENVHDFYISSMVIMTKNGHDEKSVQDTPFKPFKWSKVWLSALFTSKKW